MKKFNVIDSLSQFQDPSPFLHSLPWNDHYRILSIIGSQSSGKSTLLNQLFKTDFQVLNSKVKRGQTTKGIWLSCSQELPLMVLDVQGSDSKQRWDKRNSIQQSTALLSLCLSDALILNLWNKEIGRFAGSQLGIIKVIMEMNIRLFKQESLKQIVVVIRDFDQSENLAKTVQNFNKNITAVWQEVQKPQHIASLPLTNFYRIHYVTLSHYIHKRGQFDLDVQRLRQMLSDKQSANYIFEKESNNLPIGDVGKYIGNLWDVIINERDLNLPEQKTLVANLRCEEIRNKTIEQLLVRLNELRNYIDHYNQQLPQKLKSCMAQAQQWHRQLISNYKQDVKARSQGQLKSMILKEVQKLFLEYAQNLRQEQISTLDDYVKKLHFKGSIKGKLQKLSQFVNARNQEECRAFRKKLEGLLFQQSWLSIPLQKLRFSVDQIINRHRLLLIERGKQDYKLDFQNKLSDLLEDAAKNRQTGWQQNMPEIQTLVAEYQASLKQVYKSLSNEGQTPQFQAQREVDTMVKVGLSKMPNLVSDTLSLKLKQVFEYKDGKPINWKFVQQQTINNSFLAAKKQVLLQAALFGRLAFRSSHIQTFSQEQIDAQLKRFQFFAEGILQSALSKHRQSSSLQVPAWMWTVLIIFLIDDILIWMTKPMLFIPLLLILVVVGVTLATGQKQLATSTFKRVSRLAQDQIRKSIINKIL